MSVHAGADAALERFLAKHEIVRALPENAPRIVRLAGDPNSQAHQLLKLISQDAALTSRIMAVVNSAQFALPNRVSRLDQAVALLGLRNVRAIVVSTMMQSLGTPVRLGAYDARALWDHTLAVAVAARELAARSGAADPDEAFLIGMLHDIGLLLLAQAEPQRTCSVFDVVGRGGPPSFRAAETATFGFDHTLLGERLATNWKLPVAMVTGIRWHHAPLDVPEPHRRLCLLLFAADTLCCQAGVGCPLTARDQQLLENELQAIKVSGDVLQDVAARLPVLLRLHHS